MYVGHYELELETVPVIEFRIKEPETFGEYIRRLRLLKGWSQRQLAQKIGTWSTTILNWENDFCIPQRKTIIKLIKELGASVWEAFRFNGVITNRQRKILSVFEEKPSFTHGDCMELIGSGYLRDDLNYLVNFGVIEEERKENKIFYRIKRNGKAKSLGELIREHRLDNAYLLGSLAVLLALQKILF